MRLAATAGSQSGGCRRLLLSGLVGEVLLVEILLLVARLLLYVTVAAGGCVRWWCPRVRREAVYSWDISLQPAGTPIDAADHVVPQHCHH